MTQPAIIIENLGKAYNLGHRAPSFPTFREALVSSARSNWRRVTGRENSASVASFWALKDFSLQVQPGEVVGIIGRNGAGKSTLLKILSRITEPTEGCARIRGRLASLLEVGTGFHPELTGRENIYLNGSILGMKKAEIDRKFDEIVTFAETEQFLDTQVKHYSSGMYVRLAFAVSAHLEPEILIIDEVLAVGDAVFQARCLGKMSEVAHSGRTVLFVSHNMTAVQQLCSRSALVVSGRLAAEGPTNEIITRYLSDGLSSEDGRFDLSHHNARQSGHLPLIHKLVLYDGEGRPSTRFFPNEPLEAELTIVAPEPIRMPRVAMAIEDNLGRRIMTTASFFQDPPLGDLAGECQLRCRIPRLALGNGRYMLSVSIGTRYTGLLDSLQYVAWFDVEWNNNFGNGEPFDPVYGPVLTAANWERVS